MSTLNDAQQRAVDTSDGPVLIIAGAGSGKTRVITQRILNLIKKGVAPHNILAITFTNKAAKEMRERVNDLIAHDKTLNVPISFHERPFLSTFHALGVHIIRENAALLGLTRHFTICDRGDSKRAVKEAMEQSSIDPKQFDPGTMLNMISRAKGDGMSRLEYADAARDHMQEMVAQVWEKYDAALHKDKSLDFDDLLLKTMQLLAKRPEVRAKYQSLWKYIHIDEYQDTNKVQYKIAQYLAEGHHNICVVGDADQNIYSWRGATIENILNFEKDYPETTVIALEKNYRSTKTILAAANNVIEKNHLRKKKTLYTDNDAGEKISLNASYTEVDEARNIADTARVLIEKGTSARDIAVLYRANFQSRALEEAFIKKNIPYQLLGVRFFERKEVKDVLSYIRAALNKESWADIGRVINTPTRGIGKVSIAKIMSGRSDLLPSAMQEKLRSFWKLLDDIRHEIYEKKPSEAVRFVIQETGLERMLRSGDAEDEERLLNIQELVTVAAQYDEYSADTSSGSTNEVSSPTIGFARTQEELAKPSFLALPFEVTQTPSQQRSEEGSETSFVAPSNVPTVFDTIPAGMEAFLTNAALASDQDDLEKDHDAVRLMTVHASKGLEFDHVFIAGLEQDLFPFKHMDDTGMSESESEEERRLFYVALTRARKRVHLSHTLIRTVYGAQRVNTPSEFIGDIEASLIEDQAPPEKPSGAKALFIDF
ncbi:MAG: UvrD-helicase domain-containing protein [Candidatus Pacebacteria bacterium]|nr:UvrD-helicase domain-containing protein [Candidatus Paceibacterota bacterium]